MDRPGDVIVLGKCYSITYVDHPCEVDKDGREALWGQLDTWMRRIRVYDNGRCQGDLLETVIHEVLHAIAIELNITALKDNEDAVELLALALADTLTRNGWLKVWNG